MVISVSEQFAVDSSLSTRLQISLSSVTAKVVEEGWADENILLLFHQFEVLAVTADADRGVGCSVVDVSHHRKASLLVPFERTPCSVHLATLSPRPCVAMLAEEVKNETLPQNVNENREVGIGDLKLVTEPLKRVEVSCP